MFFSHKYRYAPCFCALILHQVFNFFPFLQLYNKKRGYVKKRKKPYIIVPVSGHLHFYEVITPRTIPKKIKNPTLTRPPQGTFPDTAERVYLFFRTDRPPFVA